MKTRSLLALTAVLVAASVARSEDAPITSLPLRIGDSAVPFLVRDCTGPAAGKRLCYMCRYATRPVVAVFTRSLDDDTASLVKEIDDAVKKYRQQRLSAFVVLIAADTTKTENQLKALASKKRISETPLTIFSDQQNKLTNAYGIGGDSPLTITLWRGSKLVALKRLEGQNENGRFKFAFGTAEISKIIE